TSRSPCHTSYSLSEMVQGMRRAQCQPIHSRHPLSVNVIEIFLRLGVSLLLSLCLALLLAWSWDQSDAHPDQAMQSPMVDVGAAADPPR
ncbi:MAG: hypothetical protein ACK40L_18785, partial [Hydrogenophaga sp.]